MNSASNAAAIWRNRLAMVFRRRGESCLSRPASVLLKISDIIFPFVMSGEEPEMTLHPRKKVSR
jgi:hypothetical protein